MPTPRVRSSGVIEIEEIVGALTVSVVEPLMFPKLAEIVVLPAPTPEARPFTSMLATMAEEEFQLTCAVKSLLLPSL